MVATAAGIAASGDVQAIAMRYGGPELRVFEERRNTVRERLTELRHRFVEGLVLVLPAARSAAFTTNGMFPILGVGTVYLNYRGRGEWGPWKPQRSQSPKTTRR